MRDSLLDTTICKACGKPMPLKEDGKRGRLANYCSEFCRKAGRAMYMQEYRRKLNSIDDGDHSQ